MSSVETGQMSAVETGQMSAVETGQMSAVETRQMYSIETGQSPVSIVNICLVSTADICPVSAADICPVSKDISSGVVQEAEVCSLSIKLRFLELIPEHNRGRPAQTSAVPGYGVKHPQTDPPHPRAKARMTAVRQTPSNDV